LVKLGILQHSTRLDHVDRFGMAPVGRWFIRSQSIFSSFLKSILAFCL
jgi:hypothetical protein